MPDKKIILQFDGDYPNKLQKIKKTLEDAGVFEDENPTDGLVKATLEFNMDEPYTRDEFNDALNGTNNKIKLDDIWNEVFRPYYKHGYQDKKLNELLECETFSEDEKLNETVREHIGEVIDKLADIYRDVASED